MSSLVSNDIFEEVLRHAQESVENFSKRGISRYLEECSLQVIWGLKQLTRGDEKIRNYLLQLELYLNTNAYVNSLHCSNIERAEEFRRKYDYNGGNQMDELFVVLRNRKK